MSNTKPSDYLAWTQKNFPSLTDQGRNTLCEILSAQQVSLASLQATTATAEVSRAVISAILKSTAASWRADGLSTVQSIPAEDTAKTKLPVPDQG